MLVDTHTHLQFPAFDADREAVLARAWAAGVARLVVVGTDLPSSRAALALAKSHPGRVWATVGFHPHEAQRLDAAALAELGRLACEPEVVAIGEVGLDYYRDHCPRAAQHEALRRQMALALARRLPLVIHSRDALDEIDAELEQGGGYGTRVVLHCYTSHPEEVSRFAERGCWLSVSGPVAFPRATDAHEVAATVPADRLLLETDCPYLAPPPHRGQRAEPAHVRRVAEAVARLRGATADEVIAMTGANAAAFFGWAR